MASKNPRRPSITRVAFRSVVSQARTTNGDTYATLDLTTANLGARGYDISQDFEFFRIVDLHIYSFIDGPNVGTSSATVGGGTYHAISFMNTPAGSFSAPTTKARHAQHENFVADSGWRKIALRVRKQDLMNQPLKWFNAASTGTVPASSQSAGTITYMMGVGPGVTITSISQNVVLEGVMELHTPITYPDSFKVVVPRQVSDEPAVAKALQKLRLAVGEAETETERPEKERSWSPPIVVVAFALRLGGPL